MKIPEQHNAFLLAAREKWGVGDKLTPKESEELLDLTTHLLEGDSEQISPGDLDTMWAVYYATGDRRYPDRVQKISKCSQIHPAVRGAAMWSYNSHMQQNLL